MSLEHALDGYISAMDIIRHDDGSLTVPVAPSRQERESEEAVESPAETVTLRPGEGGYNEALAQWNLQQDPARGEPVSTVSGREEAMLVVHAVAEDPKHIADAVKALDDAPASAEALRYVLVGGDPSVKAFCERGGPRGGRGRVACSHGHQDHWRGTRRDRRSSVTPRARARTYVRARA